MNEKEFEGLVEHLRSQGVKVGDWRHIDEVIDETKNVKGYIEIDEIDSEQFNTVFSGYIVHIVPNNDSYIQINIYHEVS